MCTRVVAEVVAAACRFWATCYCRGLVTPRLCHHAKSHASPLLEIARTREQQVCLPIASLVRSVGLDPQSVAGRLRLFF